MKIVLFISIVLFLIAAPASHAADVELDAITVSASRTSQIDSMEVREVRESNAVDPGEALSETPGVTKVRKGGVANDVVIRGFKKDNINVLLDGAKLYGACPNKMDPPAFHVDFAEVSRMDVLKGPFDVKNQGSLGGTVSIETKKATDGVSASLEASYGSDDETSLSATASYGANGAGVLAGAAFRYAEPYEDGTGRRFTEIYPEDNPARYRQEERDGTAYNIKTGWFNLSVAPAEDANLDLSYTHQDARDVLYPYLVMDADLDIADRFNASYRFAPSASALDSVRLQFYANNVRHDMTDARRVSSLGLMTSPYKMRTDADSSTVGGRIETELSRFGTTTVGIDFYRRRWDAVTTMIMKNADTGMEMAKSQASMPNVFVSSAGLYVDQRNHLSKRIIASGGLRLDSTRSEAHVDRSSLYDLYFSTSDLTQTDTVMSGYLKLDAKFSEEFSAFVGAGHTVRVPDPEERFFALEKMRMPNGMQMLPDRVGNPGLDPVENNEADLGFEYAIHALRLRGQVFVSDLSDFIIVRDVTTGSGMMQYTARTYQGIDAFMYGGELSADLALPLNLFARAGISLTVGENDTEDIDLQEVPPLSGMASLRWDNGTFFAETVLTLTDRQDRVDELIEEQETPGWQTLDLKAGYEAGRIRILGGVRNLFDQAYEEHLSYYRDPFASGVRVPEPGRTFYLALRYSI